MPYNGGFLQFVTKSTLFNNKLKSKCYEKKSTFNVNAWCSNVVCMLYTRRSTVDDLNEYCKNADFVFNLAGVNRPKEQSEFMSGNFGFASLLLDTLKKYNNTCPVMLSSSIQATLIGRYGESDYGKSKLAGEELFFEYAQQTGS